MRRSLKSPVKSSIPIATYCCTTWAEDLADHRPDFEATGAEWRTPPLWGIGLTQTVNGHTHLLHDGRARNVIEAILWHGGEASYSRHAFLNMAKADRLALLRFLGSL